MVVPILLVLLVATPALAPLAGDVAPIENNAAAQQLCLATRPVDRFTGTPEEREGFKSRRRSVIKARRVAAIPLDQLGLGDFEENDRRFTLERTSALRTREGVHLFPGQDDFELQATSAVPEGDHALSRTVVSLRRSGRGLLRFTFELADAEGGGPCPIGARPGSRPVLAVRPIDLELLDAKGTVLATGRGSDAPEGRRPPGGKPATAIAPATVSGSGPLASVVTTRAQERLPALQACFEEALARDGTIDGSIVFQIDIDAKGGTRGMAVSADTVQDEPLLRCARHALEVVSWGKGGPSQALVPVHFDRE